VLNAAPTGELSVSTIPVSALFQAGIDSYTDEIRLGAERSAALIASFARMRDARVALSLSGGHDSRMCLAASMYAGAPVVIRSNVRHIKDFSVVSALAQRFSFDVNNSITSGKGTPVHQLERWAISNMGIYDPLHAPVNLPNPAVLNISGTGAEMFKGNYGWRKIATIAKLVPDVGMAFRNEAERGIANLGISPDDPFGSEWHYLGYRNAIHAGRSTMSSLLGIRPFMQKRLVGLSRSPLNVFHAPKKGAPSIVTDLMIALNPSLAAEPFDVDAKNLSWDFIDQRIAAIGQIDSVFPYTISGSPNDDVPGLPNSFIDRITRQAFKSRFRAGPIAACVDEGWQKLPLKLQETYRRHQQLATQEISEPVSATALPSMAAGKLISFCLAD
jgi:hypothetical protein